MWDPQSRLSVEASAPRPFVCLKAGFIAIISLSSTPGALTLLWTCATQSIVHRTSLTPPFTPLPPDRRKFLGVQVKPFALFSLSTARPPFGYVFGFADLGFCRSVICKVPRLVKWSCISYDVLSVIICSAHWVNHAPSPSSSFQALCSQFPNPKLLASKLFVSLRSFPSCSPPRQIADRLHVTRTPCHLSSTCSSLALARVSMGTVRVRWKYLFLYPYPLQIIIIRTLLLPVINYLTRTGIYSEF